MSSIAYAWEFGANLGHIGTFLPIARDLRAHGHDVHWMVTHTNQAAKLLDREGFSWLQAPVIGEVIRKIPPQSYADILLRFGYASVDDLLGLLVAWRQLLLFAKPALLLADHAPTAILAARTLDIPVMLFGNGFFAPPQISPLPNMRPWTHVPMETLVQLEQEALASVNFVLRHFAREPLGCLAELFQVAETSLLTFPELDHYAQRSQAAYWGTLPAAVANPPVWSSTARPRVYAYLRANSPHCEAALQTLGNLRKPCLVYCPDIPQAMREKYSSTELHFADAPVDLNLAAQEADAAVTYGSPAATIAFLLAGKPVLMLPGHLEQFLFALRVEGFGAGLLINPEHAPADLPQKLQRILFEPSFAENARAFAKKYESFNQAQVQAHLVNRIEELAHSATAKGSP
jgi:UDP:flavonoid glycosyltransferase YjiC (YdhE family)